MSEKKCWEIKKIYIYNNNDDNVNDVAQEHKLVEESKKSFEVFFVS